MSKQPSYTTLFKADFSHSNPKKYAGCVEFSREDENMAEAERTKQAVPVTARVQVRDELENVVLTIELKHGEVTLSDLHHKNIALTMEDGMVPVFSASAEDNDQLGVLFAGIAGVVLKGPDKPPYEVAEKSLRNYCMGKLALPEAQVKVAPKAAPAPEKPPSVDGLQPWFSAVVIYNVMLGDEPKAQMGRMSFRRESQNAEMATELGGTQPLLGELRIDDGQGNFCATIRFTKDGVLYSDAQHTNVPMHMDDGIPIFLVVDDQHPQPIREFLDKLAFEVLQAPPTLKSRMQAAQLYLAGKMVPHEHNAPAPEVSDIFVDNGSVLTQPIFDSSGEHEIGWVQYTRTNAAAARRVKGYSQFAGEVKVCDADGRVVTHLLFEPKGVTMKSPGEQPVLGADGKSMTVKYGQDFLNTINATADELLSDHSRPAIDIVQENLQRLNERVHEERKSDVLPRLLQRDANKHRSSISRN
jgi:hypothetical protein